MARGVLQLLGAACLALASGARAQASCDVTDFVLPSNVGIDSCDGLVCTTDATAGTTTCSGTVAHAATCTLKCAPPGAFDCQRGDACTRIDSDDIRTAGPPDAYDLDGDGVADLLDATTYPNVVRGVEHPWLLSGGDTPLQAVVSLNARDGGLVRGGEFDVYFLEQMNVPKACGMCEALLPLLFRACTHMNFAFATVLCVHTERSGRRQYHRHPRELYHALEMHRHLLLLELLSLYPADTRAGAGAGARNGAINLRFS
jgi:hypothetical protein